LARARAIESHVSVVTCNRVGQERIGEAPGAVTHAHFCGGSQIVGPDGEKQALAGAEALLAGEVQPDASGPRNVMCDDLNAEWNKYRVELGRGRITASK
jgi:predicted amidohydrolase